jgi:hypothetical protein
VPETRSVLAGNGLTGGGTLAADRTFSVNYATATPLAVGSATVGTGTAVARGDHVHPAIDLTDGNQTTGALATGRGGLGDSMSPVAGTVIYSNGTYLDQTNVGTSGYILSSFGAAAPNWINPASLSVSTASNISGGAANRIVYQTAPSTTGFLVAPTVTDTYLRWNGSAMVWSEVAGGGTVTSVDGSGGTTGLTVTGGPITLAGTLTLGGTLAISAGGTGLGSTPTNGQLLIGNGSGYTKSALTAGTGISIANATGSISIANTAPDQTVTLTGSTAISVSGAYPSFTLTNTAPDQTVVLTGSTAISVAGTYPSFTLTNTAPDQTVVLTGSTAISVSGSYPSFTLTNTAPDQTVTLTSGTNVSVSGTYPSFTVASPNTVVGPAGATSTAVALFDGGTGKLLKNSAVTISATGVISGVASPEANTDAANKLYVDGLVSTGLTFHDPVQLATTSAFTGYSITYNNGTAGVSATITQASSYASLTIDSTDAAANNRILVKDAANAAYNGIYYVTSTGSGATPWVLTRTSDADTYGPAVGQLSRNDYFFTQNGVANKGAAFVCTTSGTITFGTTGITFTEFSVSQVYTAGNGLSLTATTFALNTPVSVLNGGTGLSSAASNGQLPIGNGAGYTLSGLTAGTGISVTNATGSISIANTSPDQTVTLTGSTAISVSGTYPSFTLTNTAPDQTVILTGSTAISIAGTYPSFTVTNTSPDRTVILTGAGGASISGTYPSFTITSTAGTVTSVDGSSTLSGVTLSGGPITSSGRLTIAGTLGISSGGTAIGTTPTNGQVLVGNGTGYTLATISAGSNITITNGTGSITIAATASGGTVTSVDGSSTVSGFTLSGGPITSSGRLTLGGTLGISNGGTGLGTTPTNGQLDIGNGVGFTRTALTAGTGVTITNGTGSITIAASGITTGKSIAMAMIFGF